MGQPVLDRSATRLERSVLRSNENRSAQAMYGTSDYRAAMILRMRQLARQARNREVPGDVIYDVEPVQFDDLIEIRTGGDRAFIADVDLGRFGARWVSYWPLSAHTADDTMGGWEQAIQNTAERRHYMVVETDSLIEQFLTFDMGYRAFGRDDQNDRYRMMTSDRFVEELRELQKQYLVDVGLAPRPRRQRETYYDASTLQMASARSQERVLYRNAVQATPLIDSTNYRVIEEPDRPLYRNTYTAVNSGTATWTPMPEPIRPDDDDGPTPADEPEAEWDAEAWEYSHRMTSHDGRRVEVDENGLDANGVSPATRGYVTGACNCDECMESRAEALDDDDDYDDSEGDYDTEDEG